MKPQQNWKDIYGFEDLYEVSDLGVIFSRKEGRVIEQGHLKGRKTILLKSIYDVQELVDHHFRQIPATPHDIIQSHNEDGIFSIHYVDRQENEPVVITQKFVGWGIQQVLPL